MEVGISWPNHKAHPAELAISISVSEVREHI